MSQEVVHVCNLKHPTLGSSAYYSGPTILESIGLSIEEFSEMYYQLLEECPVVMENIKELSSLAAPMINFEMRADFIRTEVLVMMLTFVAVQKKLIVAGKLNKLTTMASKLENVSLYTREDHSA
jgi:hypothetical protein